MRGENVNLDLGMEDDDTPKSSQRDTYSWLNQYFSSKPLEQAFICIMCLLLVDSWMFVHAEWFRFLYFIDVFIFHGISWSQPENIYIKTHVWSEIWTCSAHILNEINIIHEYKYNYV